jgi:hypothetical protein
MTCMDDNIPCSLENDMPSSKSSSQLSVCSSGWLRTAGKGRARGAAFLAVAGGTTFLAADDPGGALKEDARATGEDGSLKRGLTGEAGDSCRATSRWLRPPCFEGRDGARQRRGCRSGLDTDKNENANRRLTSERLVPLLYLEHGFIKVVVTERARPFHLSIRALPVGHLLFRGKHPWMT